MPHHYTNNELETLLTNATGNGTRFPAHIGVDEEDNQDIVVDISHGVTKNMQTDSAAFEAWILILRFWLWQNRRFVLKWTSPDLATLTAPQRGHYQRFLYRAKKYEHLFNGWFRIEPTSTQCFNDSTLHFVSNAPAHENYLLNVPINDAQEVAANIEAQLERLFLGNNEFRNTLNLANINQQLPIGLFANNVANANRIFPTGKIDLWGISTQGRSLNIFELKEAGNVSLGIITELFFYAMVLEDKLNGIFAFSDPNSNLRGPIGNITPQNISCINAWFLAPRLHPLISQGVIQILNNNLTERHLQFRYIRFTHTTPPPDITIGDIEIVW